MNVVSNESFDEERALYGQKDLLVKECKFDGPADGESAMKECSDLKVENCYFNLRYPFWHVENAIISDSEMTSNCRAALWYDNNITLDNCVMNGIKALRECSKIVLKDCAIDSPEFLWRCADIKVEHSQMKSEYPFFECKDIEIEDLDMTGKYSFQYTQNMKIKNSILNTKDAFWHSKDVTVEDSMIIGEYLGWYSENLKLVKCKIIGTQPLCYCKNLVLEDCEMIDTDLAFERSEVNAKVLGNIISVKNPIKGSIVANSIDEIIMEPEYTDIAKVSIITNK